MMLPPSDHDGVPPNPNPNTKPSNLVMFSAVSYSEEDYRKLSKESLAAENTKIGCRTKV
jgi:hypothetical protein